MKKILLFAGCDYEEGGGMDDFIDDFETVPEAFSYIDKDRFNSGGLKNDWAQIVDYETMEIVKEYQSNCGKWELLDIELLGNS